MIDALGHPITEGCMVLTPGYWSPTVSEIVKVKKVTKTRIVIDLMGSTWCRDAGKYVDQVKTLYRRPHQVVVIDKQLKYNRKTYPELMI